MDDQVFAVQMVEEFRSLPGGRLFGQLFDILIEQGLKPHGSANSKTLLFKWADAKGNELNLVAFRRNPARVLSLPKSFWPNHRAKFESFENPLTTSTTCSQSAAAAGRRRRNHSGRLRCLKQPSRSCGRYVLRQFYMCRPSNPEDPSRRVPDAFYFTRH